MFDDLCSVLKIFKTFNPQTVIILMLFAFGIKLGYIIHPPAITIGNDEWGFEWIMKGIQNIFGSNPRVMVLLGMINLVLQSLVVNRLASEYKLFSTDSFVPAALFLIISSLVPEWNTISAPLIANWFILFVINNLLRLPFTTTPNKLLFNTGMFTALAGMCYYPSLLFVAFIVWSVLMLQPFKIKDPIIILLGLITPVYFLVSFCYLLDIPFQHFHIDDIHIQNFSHLKAFPSKTWMVIGLISFVGILSTYFLNQQLNKQVEAGKKMWWIVILCIIIANLVALFNVNDDGAFWYFSITPIALLATNTWMAETNKWIKIILFWILIAAVIYIQYM